MDNDKKSFLGNLSPKTAFFTGLFGGILVICAIGFFVLLIIMLGGDNNNTNKVSNNNNNLNNANTNQVVMTGDPAPISDSDHIIGNKNAKIVMIEYSDFQCPYCKNHQQTMNQLVDEYGDDIAWVYRHFPIPSLHPFANMAALSSECAAEQGKFWEYSDALYDNQDSFSSNYFGELAGQLGLKTSQFDDCLSSAKYQSVVSADIADAEQAGITGTPGTFINGELVKGAVPYESLKSYFDTLLNS